MEELNLIQQGYFKLKMNDFSSASQLFLKALESGEDANAYIGVLLSENSLTEESQLVTLPSPLGSYPAFQRAAACADEQVKKKLRDYQTEQVAFLQKKEEAYRVLVEKKDESDLTTLKSLIASARELKGYKDSDALRAQFESRLSSLEDADAKKKKKKIVAVAVAIVLVIAALTIAVFVFALPKIGGVRYALTLNGFTVISCDGDLKEVVIPDEIRGVKVTAIGRKAFKNCGDLETVTLGKYVRLIERAAFNGCARLRTLIGSESVENVEENAFKDCRDLRTVVFAPDCTIHPDAFRDCSPFLEVYVGGVRWGKGPKDGPRPADVFTVFAEEA